MSHNWISIVNLSGNSFKTVTSWNHFCMKKIDLRTDLLYLPCFGYLEVLKIWCCWDIWCHINTSLNVLLYKYVKLKVRHLRLIPTAKLQFFLSSNKCIALGFQPVWNIYWHIKFLLRWFRWNLFSFYEMKDLYSILNQVLVCSISFILGKCQILSNF